MEQSFTRRLFGLDDKIILVTGGSGTIAKTLACGLLKSGARVALAGRNEETLQKAREEIMQAAGGEGGCIHLVSDMEDEASVARLIPDIESKLGRPNVLLNTVGGNRGKSAFIETETAAFEAVLRLNLLAGFFIPTKVIAAYWIRNGIRGSVINLASMASFIPLSGVWAYDAAKAGVVNLTKACAKEFGQYGIRVNAIAPGFFLSPQNRDLLVRDSDSNELTERGQAVIRHTPFGRFGEASEITGAAIFLSSDRASGFVTGITLPVDGGFLVDNI